MATAGTIVRRALQRLQVVGIGDQVPAELHTFGLETLNTLLQQLPQEVVIWPNLKATQTAVAWSIGSPEYVAIPADYWGDPVLTIADANGNPSEIRQIPASEWETMIQSQTGATVVGFFEDRNTGRWMLWPTPDADPGVKACYVEKPAAVNELQAPDLPEHWALALEYGLAFHQADHFGKDPAKFFPLWESLKAKAIGATVESAPISITLED